MKQWIVLLLISFGLISCTGNKSGGVKGVVSIDGSSTVFPITEAVAEEFMAENPSIRVNIGVSGTGGGFKKFLSSEIDINNASRTIKSKEAKAAKENKIEYIELPVAFDGISVVVSKKNTWVDSLSSAELKKIWEPESKVNNWKDVRDGWPDKPIKLYGPGPDSGTFDYFTHAIMGKAQVSRSDYTKSEDDNVLVMGVSGDEGALGYFGFAYFEENKEKLKIVPVKHDGGAAVTPTLDSISKNEYKPLSRPIFIYVNKSALAKKPVKDFIDFYIESAPELSEEVGYVPMPAEKYSALTKLVGSSTEVDKKP